MKYDKDSYLNDSERRQVEASPEGLSLGHAVKLLVQLGNTPIRSEKDLKTAINLVRGVKEESLPAIVKSLANVANLLMATRQVSHRTEPQIESLGGWQARSLAKLGVDSEAFGITSQDSPFLAGFVTSLRKKSSDSRQTPAEELRVILEGYFKGEDTQAVGARFGLTRSATAQRISATINWIAENRDHDELRSAFERGLIRFREEGLVEEVALPAVQVDPQTVDVVESADATISEKHMARHEQIASDWAAYVGFDEESTEALSDYLDPASEHNHELDQVKLAAIAGIVYAGRRHFDSLDNPFLDLSREEQFRLRQVTGGWYERRANDAVTPPKPLSEMLRFAPLKSAPGIEDVTFSALERLLEAAQTKDRLTGQIPA